MKSLKTSTLFIDMIKAALGNSDWPTDDSADENLPIALSSGETDNQIQIKMSQIQNMHSMWGVSQGLPRGSKQAVSPDPESSVKHHRSTPSVSGSNLVVP